MKMINISIFVGIVGGILVLTSLAMYRHYSVQGAVQREKDASSERDSLAKAAQEKRDFFAKIAQEKSDSIAKKASDERKRIAKQAEKSQSEVKSKVDSANQVLVGISSKTDKILENTNISRKEAEIVKFFRENNFSLEAYFKNGYRITRQFKSGNGFSKVVNGIQVNIYENMTDKLIFNVGNDRRTQIRRNGSIGLPEQFGTMVDNEFQGKKVILDKNFILVRQDSGSVKINDTCDVFLLLQIDDMGWTFAVGRGPCP